MRAAALAGALSLLALAPAGAQAARGLETQRFMVSVKGVQTTAWSYDVPSVALCNPGGTGEGTEVMRFSTSRPKVIEAVRFSRSLVQFGVGPTAGVIGARVQVTRRRQQVDDPMDPSCRGTGGEEILAPDCGTKRGVLDLRLSYEGFGRPRGVKLRNSHTATPDMFEACSMNGVTFPTLLDQTTNGGGIASDWPLREIYDRRIGKTIVIGRGRKVVEDATSRQETTIRWEVTFRRLTTRSGGASR
jgi:hypothetical protein